MKRIDGTFYGLFIPILLLCKRFDGKGFIRNFNFGTPCNWKFSPATSSRFSTMFSPPVPSVDTFYYDVERKGSCKRRPSCYWIFFRGDPWIQSSSCSRRMNWMWLEERKRGSSVSNSGKWIKENFLNLKSFSSYSCAEWLGNRAFGKVIFFHQETNSSSHWIFKSWNMNKFFFGRNELSNFVV